VTRHSETKWQRREAFTSANVPQKPVYNKGQFSDSSSNDYFDSGKNNDYIPSDGADELLSQKSEEKKVSGISFYSLNLCGMSLLSFFRIFSFFHSPKKLGKKIKANETGEACKMNARDEKCSIHSVLVGRPEVIT
jgi:hypothetical protein